MKKNRFVVSLLAAILSVSLMSCGHSHNYGELVKKVDATCTVSGMEAHYHCADCGKYFDISKNEVSFDSLVIAAKGHSYDESAWVVDTQPTCTEEGKEHLDCLVCGAAGRKERTVEHLGHHFVLVPYLDSTCVNPGHKAYYECERPSCDKFALDEQGKQLIEDINKWLGVGGEGYIAPTGKHTYEERVVDDQLLSAADCENAAVYYKSCSCGDRNGETFVYGKPLGHDYGDYIEQVDKTCYVDGLRGHFHCSRLGCGKYFDASYVEVSYDDLVIPAGHEIEEDSELKPTFDEYGHIAGYTCSLCGEHYSDEEGKTIVEEKDWYTPKLTAEEDFDKVVFADLSNESFNDCELELEGYEYVDGSLNTPDFSNKAPGDTFNVYAHKEGFPNYKITALVVSKVIMTAEDFLNLSTTKLGKAYSGYFVLGCDLENFTSNLAFDSDHDHTVNAVIDGRGHKVTNFLVNGTGGIFGTQYVNGSTLKNIEFVDLKSGSYGLLGYVTLGLTLENVKVTSKEYEWSAPGMVARCPHRCNFVNCEFDNVNNPTKAIFDEMASADKACTFENVVISLGCEVKQKLCNTFDGQPYVEEYNEEGITWNANTLVWVEATTVPTFNSGTHIAGYECTCCGKHYSDPGHKNEISASEWSSGDPLPYEDATDKAIFYNMTTSTFDNSEAPTADTSKLVDGDLNAFVVGDMKVGDTKYAFIQGETSYKYTVLAVTNTISSEAEWNANLDGTSKDLSGYYVLTADIESIVTSATGAHNNTTKINDLTIDGRKHTIGLLKSTSKTGGIFGTCGSGNNYGLVMKNLTISSFKRTQYGMLGYQPANGGNTDYAKFENFDFTVGEAYTNGLFASTNASSKFYFTNCVIDYNGKSPTYMFGAGTFNGHVENLTIILDPTSTNSICLNGAANERNGLESLIEGVTFLSARP